MNMEKTMLPEGYDPDNPCKSCAYGVLPLTDYICEECEYLGPDMTDSEWEPL